MITIELEFAYITSDGKKFFTMDEAKKHEGKANRRNGQAKNKHRLRDDNSRTA